MAAPQDWFAEDTVRLRIHRGLGGTKGADLTCRGRANLAPIASFGAFARVVSGYLSSQLIPGDFAITRSTRNPLQKLVIAGASALAVSVTVAAPLQAETLGVATSCTGTTPDEWGFAADALDGKFLHIIWTSPQGHRRVSELTYYTTNADGFPVFTGMFQDSTEIILVDESQGAAADGTEIEVFSEDWGWLDGTCQTLTTATPDYEPLREAIRQNLVGSRDTSATNWLRRNGFSRNRVVELTSTGKVESWQRTPEDAVHVVFYRGRISDVLSGRE